MGTSQSSQIYEIVNFVSFFDYRRVLDVGVGYGQYGFMLRHRVAGTMDREAMTIDGIEGYAPYISTIQRQVYNTLFIDRAEVILPTLPGQAYQCALLIDVLEHLDQLTAQSLIAQLRRVADVVLVSTPAFWIPQEDERNPLENHVSLWTERKLTALGATAFLPNEQSHPGDLRHAQASGTHPRLCQQATALGGDSAAVAPRHPQRPRPCPTVGFLPYVIH